jgi:glutaminase
MTTCGMYDFAGEWVYAVGMPAKSGVGGGILAVLPGQLGIGVFSPRLDTRGNSARGVAVCKDVSRDFSLHFLRAPRSGPSICNSLAMRSCRTLDSFP